MVGLFFYRPGFDAVLIVSTDPVLLMRVEESQQLHITNYKQPEEVSPFCM